MKCTAISYNIHVELPVVGAAYLQIVLGRTHYKGTVWLETSMDFSHQSSCRAPVMSCAFVTLCTAAVPWQLVFITKDISHPSFAHFCHLNLLFPPLARRKLCWAKAFCISLFTEWMHTRKQTSASSASLFPRVSADTLVTKHTGPLEFHQGAPSNSTLIIPKTELRSSPHTLR